MFLQLSFRLTEWIVCTDLSHLQRMRRSLGRHFFILNAFKIGKPGQKLTEKQQILKEDLERSYFKDMHDLSEDPKGKLFEAESYVGAARLDRLTLLDKTLKSANGDEKVFTAEEIRQNRRSVFIVYQMGFYASPFANEWKDRMLKRWPNLGPRIYAVEIRERNMAYSLLRWTTQNSVRSQWQSSRNEELESSEERSARLLHWQETRASRMEARALRKDLRVGMNKYLPFVFVVQEQGLITFRAVGKPKPAEFKLLATSLD